jgi:hypothetical protein
MGTSERKAQQQGGGHELARIGRHGEHGYERIAIGCLKRSALMTQRPGLNKSPA